MGTSSIRKHLRDGALVALVACSLLACDKLRGGDEGSDEKEAAEEPAEEPAGEPARTIGSFTGTWTTPWGPVKLVQTGQRISGTYSGAFTGTLEGTVDDGVADVSWTQTNGEHGRARFTIDSDGSSFKGTWGSNASATNGGPWNGERTKNGGGLL